MEHKKEIQPALYKADVSGSTAIKKPYYQLSDGADVCRVVMELSGILEWIKADEDEVSEVTDDRGYTIEPIWLTDDEYRNLPEADI